MPMQTSQQKSPDADVFMNSIIEQTLLEHCCPALLSCCDSHGVILFVSPTEALAHVPPRGLRPGNACIKNARYLKKVRRR